MPAPKDPDVAPPIHLSTTFETPNDENLIYSRDNSITRARAEKVLGDLERCVVVSCAQI